MPDCTDQPWLLGLVAGLLGVYREEASLPPLSSIPVDALHDELVLTAGVRQLRSAQPNTTLRSDLASHPDLLIVSTEGRQTKEKASNIAKLCRTGMCLLAD